MHTVRLFMKMLRCYAGKPPRGNLITCIMRDCLPALAIQITHSRVT